MILDIFFDGFGTFATDVLTLLIAFPVLMFSLSVHEFAHGFAAFKQGDSFAKSTGRLTLNPFKHMDPLGTAAMLLFGYGWAKPVPVVPANFKNGRKSLLIVSVAGIFANMLLALVAAFFSYFIVFIIAPSVPWFSTDAGFITHGIVNSVLSHFISLNVCLAIFNLIPIAPLDGYKIFKELFIGKISYSFFMNMERYSTYILLGFVIVSNRIGLISMLSGYAIEGIYSLMNLIFSAFI